MQLTPDGHVLFGLVRLKERIHLVSRVSRYRHSG